MPRSPSVCGNPVSCGLNPSAAHGSAPSVNCRPADSIFSPAGIEPRELSGDAIAVGQIKHVVLF